MRRAVAVALFLAIACRRQAAPPAAVARRSEPKTAAAARPNLADLIRGASIVSRTAEALLTRSAVRAIDGDPNTAWASPPRDVRQSMVVSLAAPVRIDEIGVVTSDRRAGYTTEVQLETSLDGKDFRTLPPMKLAMKSDPQLARVPNVDARYLRLTTLTAASTFSTIDEIIVHGTETASPTPQRIEGCWTINGTAAAFQRHGAHVIGSIGGEEHSSFEGGSDGRLTRFAWIRPNGEYGLAAATVTPDGAHISGIVWHEQAIESELFMAADWLGDRSSASSCAAPPPADVFGTYIERFGYFPLYGLAFDEAGRLDEAASDATLARVATFLRSGAKNVRFTVHELRRATSAENHAVAATAAEALTSALRKRGVPAASISMNVAGDQNPRREATTDLTRAMYSSIDIEMAR